MRKYFATILLSTACALTSVASSNSPYISEVYEYAPAPGQFVNTSYSCYKEGDNYSAVLQKVKGVLVGKKDAVLTLGAYGGYVVVGFDHTIANVASEYDFKIYGNAIVNADGGGTAEPGIVMVSADTNGDGQPNDEWYEIAGSEHKNPLAISDYRITYYRPEPAKSNIRWTDNTGGEGYVKRVDAFHSQEYYPQWIESNTMEFEGTRLPSNLVNMGTEEAPKWTLKAFDWGYADNQTNSGEYSNFKIEWATKKNGMPANLKGIDFIKIYTGMVLEFGPTGETSTEVGGIEDLHPDAVVSAEETETDGFAVYPTLFNERFFVASSFGAIVTVYNLLGGCVWQQTIDTGSTEIAAAHLSKGYYTVIIESAEKRSAFKVVKK